MLKIERDMLCYLFLSRSKTAAKLNESRERFNRLNIKVHATMNSDNSMATVSNTRTNQNVS